MSKARQSCGTTVLWAPVACATPPLRLTSLTTPGTPTAFQCELLRHCLVGHVHVAERCEGVDDADRVFGFGGFGWRPLGTSVEEGGHEFILKVVERNILIAPHLASWSGREVSVMPQGEIPTLRPHSTSEEYTIIANTT